MTMPLPLRDEKGPTGRKSTMCACGIAMTEKCAAGLLCLWKPPTGNMTDKPVLTDAECDAIRIEWSHGGDISYNALIRAAYAAGAAAVPREPFFSLTLTPKEILGLVEFSGADEADASEITIEYLYQHEGGPGWYAYLSEYPEEGSIPVHLLYDDHNTNDAALGESTERGKDDGSSRDNQI